jgi:hypothetical protein
MEKKQMTDIQLKIQGICRLYSDEIIIVGEVNSGFYPFPKKIAFYGIDMNNAYKGTTMK